jgi:D-3-phosphoglycerate dehydrogenase / 2-oxoglutarate reductase
MQAEPLDSASKIVVAPGSWGPQNWDAVTEALHAVGAELSLRSWSTEGELIAAAHDAVALVQGGPVRYTGAVLDALPNLRFLAAQGIGVDFVDVPEATRRGIVVFNLVGVIHREVAAHAMALLLCLVRQIVPMNEAMKAGKARPRARGIPHLYGQTLGLLSFGNIGRTVAREAQAFDLHVIAHDPNVPAAAMREHGVEAVSLDDLFRRSDFVSVHSPLSPETFHLVGEAQFRLMKPTAYFLNTGRGKVVDEPALIRALQEGRIAAAGLDVLEEEPPRRDNPLLAMDNVIVTPHMASASDFAAVQRRKLLGEELARCVTGHWPKYGLVNRDVHPRQPLRPADDAA